MLNETNVQNLTDDEIKEEVACFGAMWNPRDPICVNECYAQVRCLYYVSRRFLPQQALEMGHSEVQANGSQKPMVEELDPNELAGMYDLDPQGVEYAKALFQVPAYGLPVIQPDGTLKPSMSGPPPAPPGSAAADAGGTAPVLESSEILEDVLRDDVTAGDDTLDKVDPKAVEALDNIQKSKEEVDFDPDAPPIIDGGEGEEEGEEMPPKKTVTKKKVVKKKVVKKKVQKKAPSAKKKVVAKKAPKAQKPKDPKLDPTFASRFQKDLQKPFISALPWGHVLEKNYKGKSHKVTVTKEGFEYGGQLYPTLYAVQLDIEGRPTIGGKVQASMSTKRFFNLG